MFFCNQFSFYSHLPNRSIISYITRHKIAEITVVFYSSFTIVKYMCVWYNGEQMFTNRRNTYGMG
jgi:hypothetical protein